MLGFGLSWDDVGGRGLVSSEPVFFTSSTNNEYVRDAEPPPEGVDFLRSVYDPQGCQSAGASRTNRGHCNVVARALIKAARALVFVPIFTFLVPCVFACRFVSHTSNQ